MRKNKSLLSEYLYKYKIKVQDFADIIGVKKSTVEYWLAKGCISWYKINTVSSKTRISFDKLSDEWEKRK